MPTQSALRRPSGASDGSSAAAERHRDIGFVVAAPAAITPSAGRPRQLQHGSFPSALLVIVDRNVAIGITVQAATSGYQRQSRAVFGDAELIDTKFLPVLQEPNL